MVDVRLLRFNVIAYVSGVSAVSASSQRAGVMRTRTSTCSSADVYTADVFCLAWYRPNVVLILRITQAWNTVNWGNLKSHYISCLLSLRFFPHV